MAHKAPDVVGNTLPQIERPFIRCREPQFVGALYVLTSARALVCTSATRCSEGGYSSVIGWFRNAWRMKWCRISICFDLE